jgi:hypothetical protein
MKLHVIKYGDMTNTNTSWHPNEIGAANAYNQLRTSPEVEWVDEPKPVEVPTTKKAMVAMFNEYGITGKWL